MSTGRAIEECLERIDHTRALLESQRIELHGLCMVHVMTDELLRQRLRRVVRDFFQDKPTGTTIEQHDLDKYHRQLQETVDEHRRRLNAALDARP